MLEQFTSVLEKDFTIVLSSGSPRRKEILSLALPNKDFLVIPSTAEENLKKSDYNDRPWEYAIATADLKASEVLKKVSPEKDNIIVIGADTVISYGGQIFGKPSGSDDARQEMSSGAGPSKDSPPWESKLKFDTFCKFLEKVSRESKKPKKLHLLNVFFDDCRGLWIRKDSDSLFPIIRLLLPYSDRERKAFGIKESLLAKLYIDMLSLGSESKDALKLKNYRIPKGQQSSATGDFASVLYEVILDRSYEGSSDFSVFDFNNTLDEIADESGGRKNIEKILGSMFRKMNASQQKWTVRIILKDTKLGLGLFSILGVIHEDAKEYYESHADLRMVCENLRDRERSVNEIQIRLMDPFRPMLADRVPISKIESTFNGRPYYIEKKYDGERLQIHFRRYPRTEFKFYSRNGFDFSEDFVHFQEKVLMEVFKDFSSLILDGEICAYNRILGILTQKGDQYNIRALKHDDPEYHQCFCLYDVLLLNGVILTNRPFKTRLGILKENFEALEESGRFILTENYEGKTKFDAIEALNDAIDRREEGIVLKDPVSVYKPGARTGGGWIKLKPEYAEQIVDSMDLLIIGGFYGSGKRVAGLICHFLLGAIDRSPEYEGSSSEARILTFCKVGSGYSRRELLEVLQKLNPHFQKTIPDGVKSRNKAGDRPDVWIDPKKSIILQVKAAEFAYSESFATRFTLRFPRVEAVRHDKSWDDCITVDELNSLRSSGDGKLNRGRYIEGDEGEGSSKPSPRKRAKVSVPQVPHSLKSSSNLSGVLIETLDLRGKVIVIEPADGNLKKRLEAAVVKFGGKIEQNVSEDRTFVYVETGLKLRGKGVVRSKKYDVVKSSWLLDCIKEGFRPFGPVDMVFTTEETKSKFEKTHDKFDDPYYERSRIEGLRHSLRRVRELEEELSLEPLDIAEFEDKFYSEPIYIYGIFRRIKAYFDRFKSLFDPANSVDELCDSLRLAEIRFKFYGGSTSDDGLEGLTHLFVNPSDVERLSEIKELRRNKDTKFYILTPEWIKECVSSGRIVSENPFLL